MLTSGTSTQGKSELNQWNMANYGSFLTYEEMVAVAKKLSVSGISKASDMDDGKNRWKLLEKLKSSGFSSGGLTSLAQSNNEDGIAFVKRKELILNQGSTKIFTQDMIPLMNNFVQKFNAVQPNLSNLTTNNNLSPSIYVTIPISGNADAKTVSSLNSSANNIAQIIMDKVRIS